VVKATAQAFDPSTVASKMRQMTSVEKDVEIDWSFYVMGLESYSPRVGRLADRFSGFHQ
jgi:hypothetical protein